MNDDFGVTACMKDVAQRHQLRNQFLIVINLAIEYNCYRPVLIEERLLSAGDIYDLQTAVAKTDPGLAMHSAFIRSPVELALIHAIQCRRRHFPRAAHIEDADNSAHAIRSVLSRYRRIPRAAEAWLQAGRRIVRNSG